MVLVTVTRRTTPRNVPCPHKIRLSCTLALSCASRARRQPYLDGDSRYPAHDLVQPQSEALGQVQVSLRALLLAEQQMQEPGRGQSQQGLAQVLEPV